jgi:hypothetical protein
VASFVYLAHQRHLIVLFVVVFLVDAICISPDGNGYESAAKCPQGYEQAC